jgi:P27 family predicted phage terminase small subunit
MRPTPNGKRGRPRTPTSLKLLHGEKRPSRLPSGEPVPPTLPVEPPAYLDEDARCEWERLAAILKPMGLLTAADVDHLGVLCTAIVHHRRAVELVNRTYPVIAGQRGQEARRHPAMQVIRDQAGLIASYGARFGLSPSDRASLGVVGPVRVGGYDPGDELLD